MPCYNINISIAGIMLTAKGSNVPGVAFYSLCEGEMKRDLFFKLLGLALQVEKEHTITIEDFAIGKGTKEILEFFAKTNLTEEKKIKNLVEQYLNGHMSREQFKEEIIPYRVAEKLSK